MSDNIDIKVALLQKDIESFGKVFERFDNTVNKLSDAANNLNRITMVHEEKLVKLFKEIETLKSDMKGFKQSIESLNRWRWMVIGGAGVVGYIIAKLNLGAFIK